MNLQRSYPTNPPNHYGYCYHCHYYPLLPLHPGCKLDPVKEVGRKLRKMAYFSDLFLGGKYEGEHKNYFANKGSE